MISYAIECEADLPQRIRIDNHKRPIILTWPQFQLLNEVLNKYVGKRERRPPKARVQALQSFLVSTWHKQDREKVEFLRRDTDTD